MHSFDMFGESWQIVREKRPGLWGECDSDTRKITIHTQIPLRKRLEIIIHEMLHAADITREWIQDGRVESEERWVTEAAKAIAGVLLADGWQLRKAKAKPVKPVKQSHVEGDEVKRIVVEFEPGDTIPEDAIKIDGEWHIPGEMPKPAEDDGKVEIPVAEEHHEKGKAKRKPKADV
jgi:hypothetical protein